MLLRLNCFKSRLQKLGFWATCKLFTNVTPDGLHCGKGVDQEKLVAAEFSVFHELQEVGAMAAPEHNLVWYPVCPRAQTLEV